MVDYKHLVLNSIDTKKYSHVSTQSKKLKNFKNKRVKQFPNLKKVSRSLLFTK